MRLLVIPVLVTLLAAGCRSNGGEHAPAHGQVGTLDDDDGVVLDVRPRLLPGPVTAARANAAVSCTEPSPSGSELRYLTVEWTWDETAQAIEFVVPAGGVWVSKYRYDESERVHLPALTDPNAYHVVRLKREGPRIRIEVVPYGEPTTEWINNQLLAYPPVNGVEPRHHPRRELLGKDRDQRQIVRVAIQGLRTRTGFTLAAKGLMLQPPHVKASVQP